MCMRARAHARFRVLGHTTRKLGSLSSILLHVRARARVGMLACMHVRIEPAGQTLAALGRVRATAVRVH